MNGRWWRQHVVTPAVVGGLLGWHCGLWKRRALKARLEAAQARDEAATWQRAYEEVAEALRVFGGPIERKTAPPAATGDADDDQSHDRRK